MKNIAILGLSTLFLIGCGEKTSKDNETEQTQVTDVSTTTVSHGHINKEIELTAVTAFLKKNIITAPIASYITACYIQPGTIVHSGQVIYKLESKEHSALGDDVMNASMGIVNIRTNVLGVVTDVQQQSGGYITEGTLLCTIANTSSMAFEVDVPAEDMKYAKAGTSCQISLPDGHSFTSVLSTPLASMDVNAQVQQVPAHAKGPFLPEGLRVKATLKTTSTGKNIQILPKSAVQSDDNMTSFWIMKVMNNSRAKKIPITIGNSDKNEIEIKTPILSTNDKIITTGSYQLQDGDRVKIIK